MITQAALHRVKTDNGTVVTNPPIARLIFDDTRFAVVWLVVRVLVGWEWVQAGMHKIIDQAELAKTGTIQLAQGWMGPDGAALAGFWKSIVTPAAPGGGSHYDWYQGFIKFLLDAGTAPWFAKLVAFGELFVGIALILGAFVGIAAFFGALMNWNYVMAGVASSNGLLFLFGGLLMLAWKTAGYWGLDRFILPKLGMPWPGKPVVADMPTAGSTRAASAAGADR